jgi:hypothetical protein
MGRYAEFTLYWESWGGYPAHRSPHPMSLTPESVLVRISS